MIETMSDDKIKIHNLLYVSLNDPRLSDSQHRVLMHFLYWEVELRDELTYPKHLAYNVLGRFLVCSRYSYTLDWLEKDIFHLIKSGYLKPVQDVYGREDYRIDEGWNNIYNEVFNLNIKE